MLDILTILCSMFMITDKVTKHAWKGAYVDT